LNGVASGSTLKFSPYEKRSPEPCSLLGTHGLGAHCITLCSGCDLHLEIIHGALHLWLGEFFDLLHDDQEVFSHVSAILESVLVAGLIVLDELQKDLF